MVTKRWTDADRKKAAEARRRNNLLRQQGKLPPRKNSKEAPVVQLPQAVGVTPAYEMVTPVKAEKWLDMNVSNRKLRSGVVEKYARDMTEGKWTTCTAPIVFYVDGEVADGQHRLWAVVESGMPQRFLIVRGLDRASGLNIDMGVPRNLIDNAHIAQIDTGLTTTLISLCRGIEQGDRASRYLTNSDKLGFVNKHREAAEFAVKHGGRGRYFNNAIVNSAIARAWYVEGDKSRLEHFGNVLSSGFADGDADTAAIALRNYILTRGNAATTSTDWKDIFFKVQNAVWYFMRSRKLMVIKSVSDERYPLTLQRK